MTAETHFVEVPCACPDIEACRMERYISDVRIAINELERLTAGVPVDVVTVTVNAGGAFEL